jgi:hypothetical protein
VVKSTEARTALQELLNADQLNKQEAAAPIDPQAGARRGW